MKSLSIFAGLTLAGLVCAQAALVKVKDAPTLADGADAALADRVYLPSNFIAPEKLPGHFIYQTKHPVTGKVTFQPVILENESIRREAKELDETIMQGVIDQGFEFSLGLQYLQGIIASVTDKEKAEVSIRDIYQFSSTYSDDSLETLVEQAPSDVATSRVFFVTAVRVTEVEHRMFVEKTFGGGVTSSVISVGGKSFYSNDVWSRNRLHDLNLIEVTQAFRRTWKRVHGDLPTPPAPVVTVEEEASEADGVATGSSLPPAQSRGTAPPEAPADYPGPLVRVIQGVGDALNLPKKRIGPTGIPEDAFPLENFKGIEES